MQSSSSTTSNDDVLQILNLLFQPLRLEHNFNFLFSDQPIHVPHLQSRSLFNRAFQGSVQVLRHDLLSPGARNGQPLVELHVNNCIIPTSSSSDGFTHCIGLACYETKCLSGTPMVLPPYTFYNSRICLDHENNSLYILERNPDQSMNEIMLVNIMRSGSSDIETLVTFKLDSFMQVVKETPSLPADHLLSKVTFFSRATLNRSKLEKSMDFLEISGPSSSNSPALFSSSTTTSATAPSRLYESALARFSKFNGVKSGVSTQMFFVNCNCVFSSQNIIYNVTNGVSNPRLLFQMRDDSLRYYAQSVVEVPTTDKPLLPCSRSEQQDQRVISPTQNGPEINVVVSENAEYVEASSKLNALIAPHSSGTTDNMFATLVLPLLQEDTQSVTIEELIEGVDETRRSTQYPNTSLQPDESFKHQNKSTASMVENVVPNAPEYDRDEIIQFDEDGKWMNSISKGEKLDYVGSNTNVSRTITTLNIAHSAISPAQRTFSGRDENRTRTEISERVVFNNLASGPSSTQNTGHVQGNVPTFNSKDVHPANRRTEEAEHKRGNDLSGREVNKSMAESSKATQNEQSSKTTKRNRVKTSNLSEEEAVRVRREMLRARRERNRASARRGNERVKRERNELVRNLDESRKLIVQLRKKETDLRNENLYLKRLIHKTNPSDVKDCEE